MNLTYGSGPTELATEQLSMNACFDVLFSTLTYKRRALRVPLPSEEYLLDKMIEEIEEVRTAAPDKKMEELGDVLHTFGLLMDVMNALPSRVRDLAECKFRKRAILIEEFMKLGLSWAGAWKRAKQIEAELESVSRMGETT